ncbi:MAG: hypothetical protein LBG22_12090 [Treponema sp.]|jgi:hypothetical protein|nr:hypothetical protein [Treponema sp.]
MNRKRVLIRSCLSLLWILLGIVIFVTFRGHTLLIDNHDLEAEGLTAPDPVTVTVDSGENLSFFRGDRDRFSVRGSSHRIKIEFSDGRPVFERRFTLPLKDDMYILSVPKMINGIEPSIEVFHTAPEPRRPEEEELPLEEPGGPGEI